MQLKKPYTLIRVTLSIRVDNPKELLPCFQPFPFTIARDTNKKKKSISTADCGNILFS